MRLTLMTKTKTGKISITFIVISIALVIITAIFGTNIEPTPNGRFFDHMLLALITISAFGAAAISLIVGIAAVVKHKERSILFLICLAISVLIVYFGIAQFIGEITGTH